VRKQLAGIVEPESKVRYSTGLTHCITEHLETILESLGFESQWKYPRLI
jgi:hypothetical protein